MQERKKKLYNKKGNKSQKKGNHKRQGRKERSINSSKEEMDTNKVVKRKNTEKERKQIE